jgi:hypothetical protein
LSTHTNEDDGLLSQWRAYGTAGAYAIEFDTKKLWDIINASKPPGALLDNVKYTKEQIDEELTEALSTIKEYAEEICKPAKEKSLPKEFFISCMEYLFFCKYPSFYEEQEVRLGVILQRENLSNLKLREDSRGGFAPYIESPITHDGSIIPAITRIIVGPHIERRKRCNAIQDYIAGKGKEYSHIKMETSQIPFLGI